MKGSLGLQAQGAYRLLGMGCSTAFSLGHGASGTGGFGEVADVVRCRFRRHTASAKGGASSAWPHRALTTDVRGAEVGELRINAQQVAITGCPVQSL